MLLLRKRLGRLSQAIPTGLSGFLRSQAQTILWAPTRLKKSIRKSSRKLSNTIYSSGTKLQELIAPASAIERAQKLKDIKQVFATSGPQRFGQTMHSIKFHNADPQSSIATAQQQIDRMRRQAPHAPIADIFQTKLHLATGNFDQAENSILNAYSIMSKSADNKKIFGEVFWKTYHDTMLVQGNGKLAKVAQKQLERKYDIAKPSFDSTSISYMFNRGQLRKAELYNDIYGYNSGTGLETPEEIANWQSAAPLHSQNLLGGFGSGRIGTLPINRHGLGSANFDPTKIEPPTVERD